MRRLDFLAAAAATGQTRFRCLKIGKGQIVCPLLAPCQGCGAIQLAALLASLLVFLGRRTRFVQALGPLDIVFGGIARARCRFSLATIFLFLARSQCRLASRGFLGLLQLTPFGRTLAQYFGVDTGEIFLDEFLLNRGFGRYRLLRHHRFFSGVGRGLGVGAGFNGLLLGLQFLQLLSRRLCGQFIRVALDVGAFFPHLDIDRFPALGTGSAQRADSLALQGNTPGSGL